MSKENITLLEILDIFNTGDMNHKKLNNELQIVAQSRLDALVQFVHKAANNPETIKCINNYDKNWLNEYNHAVMAYQFIHHAKKK